MRIRAILLIICVCSLFYQSRQKKQQPVITIITGLWDIKRGNLESDAKRSFEYYLSYFREFLQTESNLIIFGDNNLKSFVQTHRKKKNTVFILKDLKWFEEQWHTHYIFQILDRLKEKELDYFNTYKGQPQYGIPLYNAVVMSKPMLLKEALKYDIFDSQYFLWADGGITHAVDKRHVTPKNNALERVALTYQTPFIFQTHNINLLKIGFKDSGEEYLTGNKREYVWANFLGGRIQTIETIHSIYQNLLRITFENNDMWVDQSIFSLIIDRYPYLTATLFNFTFDKFDTFRYSSPKYFPLQQIRYFNFSNVNNSLFCTEKIEGNSIIILKETQKEGGIRDRMEYKFQSELEQHKQHENKNQLSFFKRQLVKSGLVFLYLLAFFVMIRKSMNSMKNDGDSK